MAWRLWSKVDALYWLELDTSRVASQQDFDGFTAGSTRYPAGAVADPELRDLRVGIRHVFQTSGAGYLLRAQNPRDVLVQMAAV
jgi:hypothetical protein